VQRPQTGKCLAILLLCRHAVEARSRLAAQWLSVVNSLCELTAKRPVVGPGASAVQYIRLQTRFRVFVWLFTRLPEESTMPKYVIEREMPGAGKLSAQQLQGASQKSCSVLKELGPQIQWLHSYVTDDKIYCVYIAPNKQLIEEHARKGGFPANRVSEVRTIIDPTTAEAK
jgi:hypothetical protein